MFFQIFTLFYKRFGICNLCRPKVDKKAGNLPSPTLPHALHPLTVTTPVKKTHCRSKSDATGSSNIDKDVIYVDRIICIFKNYAKCKTNVLLFTPAHRQDYNEPTSTSKCIFIFSLLIFLPRYLLQDAPQSNNRESPKVKHRRFINRSSFWQRLYLCAIFWRNC